MAGTGSGVHSSASSRLSSVLMLAEWCAGKTRPQARCTSQERLERSQQVAGDALLLRCNVWLNQNAAKTTGQAPAQQ